MLWSAGILDGLRSPCVAIVGTRGASAYGKSAARLFAARLAECGCCILSGLALGIDAAAHEGALAAGGVTIGILGSGHDRFFPRRNRELGDRIIAGGGAVLSPYPPEHQARPENFLERNGVVAALSDAVIVIEAPARSGALNTATWAAGRIPVFVVPGDIDRPQFAGSHALIRDGATLVRGPEDVIDDLRLGGGAVRRKRSRTSVKDPLQRRLLARLRQGETPLETLIGASGAAAPHVLAALSILELSGEIEARPGGVYARVR